MPRYYYCKDSSTVEGPIDEADLRRMFTARILGPDTQICLEGSDIWEPVANIPSGFSQPPDPAPSPAPVPTIQAPPTPSPAAKPPTPAGCKAGCGGCLGLIVLFFLFGIISDCSKSPEQKEREWQQTVKHLDDYQDQKAKKEEEQQKERNREEARRWLRNHPDGR